MCSGRARDAYGLLRIPSACDTALGARRGLTAQSLSKRAGEGEARAELHDADAAREEDRMQMKRVLDQLDIANRQQALELKLTALRHLHKHEVDTAKKQRLNDNIVDLMMTVLSDAGGDVVAADSETNTIDESAA